MYVMLITIFASLRTTGQVTTGAYAHGTFINLGPETVNVGNLNLHLTVPVLHKPGRGLPFAYDLSYDSSI